MEHSQNSKRWEGAGDFLLLLWLPQICDILKLTKILLQQSEKEELSGVILGKNCVRLSEAAPDDLFFSKICFIKSSVNVL